ncbi:MAG: hypothetical protein E3J72_08485 [Planctomycetota bacterium]|nr:MAG: hypothetical protein E3J72_08485 [Planctomycetota bacterium]
MVLKTLLKRLIYISVLTCILCAKTYASERVILIIINVPDDFFSNAPSGSTVKFIHSEGTLTVVGTFNSPDFEIESIKNITVFDAEDRQLALVIDESSIYREFEDEAINSVKFSFEIKEKSLETGPPTLVWGNDISADNSQVEQILLDAGNRDRYRTFNWEQCPADRGLNSQVATLEIVVDDSADIYYLWYLLPMALVFGLLIIRKIFMNKPPAAANRQV